MFQLLNVVHYTAHPLFAWADGFNKWLQDFGKFVVILFNGLLMEFSWYKVVTFTP